MRSRVRSSGRRVPGTGEAPGVRPTRELRAVARDGLGTAEGFPPRARIWNHCAPSLLRPIANRLTSVCRSRENLIESLRSGHDWRTRWLLIQQ